MPPKRSELPGPDGKLMHACVTINGAQVFLNDDYPEYNDGKSSTPTALGGTPVTIHLQAPMSKADSSRRSTPARPS